MLVGIINGYYRSGTTLMQRLYKESYPNHFVLSEPTQHEIIDHALANGCFNTNTLHGWKIFEDYCKLPRKIKHDFIRRHFEVFDYDKAQHGIMTSYGAVRYLLTPFIEAEVPIVVKSTQLHLFLDNLARDFNCWILHLFRDTARNIADHFNITDLSETGKARKILFSNEPWNNFYANLVFENLTKALKLDTSRVENNLDKLVLSIETINRIVREQAEKNDTIKIVNFDHLVADFIRNPQNVMNKLPFKLKPNVITLIDSTRINPVPDWLRDEVRKSKKKLGF